MRTHSPVYSVVLSVACTLRCRAYSALLLPRKSLWRFLLICEETRDRFL